MRFAYRGPQRCVVIASDEVAERCVTHAAIVSLIGAIEGCTVSVMPNGDASSDILMDYEQPFEISGTGEIHDGKAHIHIVAGGEAGTVPATCTGRW